MESMKRGMLLLIIFGAAVSVIAVEPVQHNGTQASLPATLASDGESVVSHSYSPGQVEYYLTDDEKTYVRPGLTIEIVGIEIPADRHPVVEVTFVDDMGLPLDREGRVTPGEISMGFVLGWYDGETRHYTTYATRTVTSSITGVTTDQATGDSGGTWEDLELGHSIYTFGTQVAEDFDQTKTHTIYVYGRRETEDILGKEYYSDPWLDFRPDGEEITEQWAKIATASCNTCHDPLTVHGRRRAIQGCVLCHQPQTMDPDSGNTVDLKVMAHKIHMGADLPSVQAGIPYQIIGRSIADFSGVVFPQDIRNCWTCHTPDAPQGYVWYTYPGREACGSCHDNIDWETGEGHPGGPAFDDSACAACHPPQGAREFDPSIMGAHTIPTKSSQLAGINMEILDVTDTAPGELPTVTFQITNDDGSMVDLDTMDRVRLRWGGPTSSDYIADYQEDALDAVMSGDVYSKTLSEPIPDEAAGSWLFTADVRRIVTIEDGTAEGLEVREAAYNPVFYAAVTDEEPEPRREVVDTAKCNACHDRLAFHGGQRFNVQECALCHRPNATDEESPPESIHLKYMIHKIHTGTDLILDYTIGSDNFNDVEFPGDRRNCEACHNEGTYGVPLPEGVLETPTERDWYTPMQPAAAACLPCHGTVDAAAHAFTNTAPFGESCGACHGDGRDYAVDKVHAR